MLTREAGVRGTYSVRVTVPTRRVNGLRVRRRESTRVQVATSSCRESFFPSDPTFQSLDATAAAALQPDDQAV